MPLAPFRICAHPGCNAKVQGVFYCALHKDDERKRKALVDKRRGSPTQRGYTSAWSRASKAFLKRHPLCALCKKEGRLTPATVTDHITPWKGDRALFWDSSNWQPLCKECHDKKTAREDGGFGNK